ncbi:MAG: cupin domain-containing protein [Sphaerochaeta sp.]|nr:cupin domain-containing protein [Sphaerochaeta sp.]
MPKHEAYLVDMTVDKFEGDEQYEVQMSHFFAISKETCDSDFVMDYCVIPEGRISRAHYHIHSALGQYFIKGEGYYICGYGTEDEKKYYFKPGTFIYVPAGVIHKLVNTGDCAIESVVTYSVGSGEATGKFYVEKPIEEKKTDFEYKQEKEI